MCGGQHDTSVPTADGSVLTLLKTLFPNCERACGSGDEADNRRASDATVVRPRDGFRPLSAAQLLRSPAWMSLMVDALTSPSGQEGIQESKAVDDAGGAATQATSLGDELYFDDLGANVDVAWHAMVGVGRARKSFQNVCVEYLSVLAVAVATLMDKNQAELGGSSHLPVCMESSNVRDAVVLTWVGVATAAGACNAFHLLCDSMTDCEAVLVGECCVDMLLQEQHRHHMHARTRLVNRHVPSRLLEEFLAACVMEWTSRGVLCGPARSDASLMDRNGLVRGSLLHLRMLWVAIQHFRYTGNVDNDAGTFVPPLCSPNTDALCMQLFPVKRLI